MNIAIASCRDLPDWEVDDRALYEALDQQQVGWRLVAWDDPDVDWSTFDVVLIRTTWDYQERTGAFADWFQHVESKTLLQNPAHVLRWNLNKRYLRSLSEEGVPIAPTVWLERGADISLAETLDANAWTSGFLKPVVGAAARATRRFSIDEAHDAQAWLAPTLARESMMLQPYLPAVETFGEVSAICVDGRDRHWVRKVPVPGDYRVQDDFGASDEPWSPSEPERSLAKSVLDAAQRLLGLSAPPLYARVDLLRDTHGKWVLTELELIEPSMFFRHRPATAGELVEALIQRLRRAGDTTRPH